MKKICLFLLALFAPALIQAQTATTFVRSLPSASSSSGRLYWVVDGASATDCTVGGGLFMVGCRSNGSVYVSVIFNQNTTGYGLGSRPLTFVGFNYQLGQDFAGSAGSEGSAGSRFCTAAENTVTNFHVLTHGSTTASGGESNWTNPIILRYGLEYPVGVTPTQMTANGQSTVVQQPGSNILWDATGVTLPAGAPYCVRPYARVPLPPASASATPAATTIIGLLTASTTYDIKLASLDQGLTSGPTAEFTCATSTSSACIITYTPPAYAYPSAYMVYLSTSTGTESLACTIPAAGTYTGASPASRTFTYTGIGCSPDASITPSAPSNIWYNSVNLAGNSTSGIGGNVADTSGLSGVISAHVGPGNTNPFGNFISLGNDTKSHPQVMVGDSIPSGTGTVTATASLVSGAFPTSNYFALAFPTPTWTPVNISTPSADCKTFYDMSQDPNFRLTALGFASGSTVHTDMCINDIGGGATWQVAAMYLMRFCDLAADVNAACYPETLTPETATTDNGLTVANQTVEATESNRTGLNSWLANGHQYASNGAGLGYCSTTTCTIVGPCPAGAGFAVGQVMNGGGATAATTITAMGTSTGCAGTFTISTSQTLGSSTIPVYLTSILACNTAQCGQPYTNVTGYFDRATAAGEVNSSGVPTFNGGFWPAPTSIPFTGLTLTGTPTNTAYACSGCSFTAGSLAGCLAVMTSGTQNGKNAVIAAGTTATSLTLYANGASSPTGRGTLEGFTGTAALAGDTFNVVCPRSYDMLHFSQVGNLFVGAVMNGWAKVTLIP